MMRLLVFALALLSLATAQTAYENRRTDEAKRNSGVGPNRVIPDRDENMCHPILDPYMRGEKTGCCRRYRKINGKGCPEGYGDCNSDKDCADDTEYNPKTGKNERKYFCVRGVGEFFGYQNTKVDVCLSKQEREAIPAITPAPTPGPTPSPTQPPVDSNNQNEYPLPAPTPYPVVKLNSPTPEPTYHDADETPTPTYAVKNCSKIKRHKSFRYMVIECVKRPDCYYKFDTMTTGECVGASRATGLRGLRGPKQHCATCKQIQNNKNLEAKYRAQLCIARPDCELVPENECPMGTSCPTHKQFISVNFDIGWTCKPRVPSSVPRCT